MVQSRVISAAEPPLRVAGACVLLALLIAGPAKGQQATHLTLSGYGLNVGTAAGGSRYSPSGVADFQRLRGMLDIRHGPVRFDVAYEHTLLIHQTGTEIGAPGLRLPSSVGNWWDLGGSIDAGEDWEWRHRLDRLGATVEIADDVELTMGRQVISWASTLLLTPADPFSPFDPADPFREYRAGVDAMRLRAYLGPTSEMDLVIRPTHDVTEDRMTALVRGSISAREWDLSAWGGALYDAAAVGVGAVGAVGDWAVRVEASLREHDGGTALRGTIGIDRRMTVRDRDLYIVAEYRRDGFGAGKGAIETLQTSAPVQRGELQLASRDAGAFQLSLQIHPLVAVSLLTLLSLNDQSGLVGPGVGWAIGSNSSIAVGAFVPWGKERANTLASEFGDVPVVGYASLSVFF